MKDYYKYYINLPKGEVIAVCHYAGRTVKSVAHCHPDDNFDLKRGKEVAKAKCEIKIGQIKVRNATEKFRAAAKAADEAERKYEDMKQYYIDSVDFLENVVMTLKNYKVD